METGHVFGGSSGGSFDRTPTCAAETLVNTCAQRHNVISSRTMRDWWNTAREAVQKAIRPSGREAARTYWVRRGLVVAAVVVLVTSMAAAVKSIGDDDPTAVENADHKRPISPTPSDSPATPPEKADSPDVEMEEPEPEPETDTPPAECSEDGLRMQVVAALDEAYVGTKVPVSVLAVNEEDVACVLEMRRIELRASKGDDVVYSSTHCSEPNEGRVELEPGDGETVQFTFPARASDADCEGKQRRLPAGEYDLNASVGESDATTLLRLKLGETETKPPGQDSSSSTRPREALPGLLSRLSCWAASMLRLT